MPEKNKLYNFIRDNRIKYFRVARFVNKECPELQKPVVKQHIEVWANGKAVPREQCVIKALAKFCKTNPKSLLQNLHFYNEAYKLSKKNKGAKIENRQISFANQ